jgi:hypothetical protein
MLGMVMVVFTVGGLAIDLWRGLAAHRQVAGVVDSAAVAAGSAIDEDAWRAQGILVLDPDRVRRRVAVAEAEAGSSVVLAVTVAADGLSARVTGTTTVDLTLLGIITEGPLQIGARATVAPVLSP